jgi:1-acyl-sn-glycerol-3-phosphate acyltransferase
MFEAQKEGFGKRLAIGRLGRGLRHYLAGVHVRGDLTALANDDRPTLYFANHISCWDGTIASYLSHTYLRQDPFIMTVEDAITPRSTRIGAFSVNAYDRFSATQSLRYSVRLLREVPRCALWMFPQGMIVPFHKRPLGFQKGTAIILSQVKEVRVVPVVLYYTLIMQGRPEAFVSFGEPLNVVPNGNVSRLTNQLEVCLVENLDKLSNELADRNTQSFNTLLYGKPTLREYLTRLRGKPLLPLKTWDSASAER